MNPQQASRLDIRSETYVTPYEILLPLDNFFDFTIDLCAEEGINQCERFYSEKDDALLHDWTGERAFMNPPYRSDLIVKFLRKAYETQESGVDFLCACLLPAHTDRKWFHYYVWNKATEIMFYRGRIRFYNRFGERCRWAMPHPSMLVVYRSGVYTSDRYRYRNPRS